MNDDDVISEIEERLSVRSMSAGRNHGHMSEMDAVEAHKDCTALLAIVKRQQEEIANLTDDISRALETIAAENEARVAAEKREAALLVEIQEAQTLLTNVRGWLSRGASEHSMENIDAYWQRWRAIGHKALAGGPT